jgi:tetratricopeptide (TPR) repeat protein
VESLGQRIRRIFDGALNISEPAERTAYLDESCGSDLELRKMIVSLLRAREKASSRKNGKTSNTPGEGESGQNAPDGTSKPDGDPTERLSAGEEKPAPTANPSEKTLNTPSNLPTVERLPWQNDTKVEAQADASARSHSTLDFPQAGESRHTGVYSGTAATAPEGIPSSPLGRADRTLEGAILPGYEILSELGRGGMGVVYKARQVKLNRLVALKMVLAGLHAGPEALARFRAEAEAVAHFQHPNIVQIHEIGEYEGRAYFSLEFVEGGSLSEAIKGCPQAPRTAARLAEVLARTMEAAHQRGIIHRDLKPANILLSYPCEQRVGSVSDVTPPARLLDDAIPKIADFGLAKRLDGDSSQTQTGTVVGTPSYMAPEQAAGNTRAIGPAADIYALGAILYDLLAGLPPFRAGNPIDTIRQVIERDPIQPRQLEPGIPVDLETICMKCLQKLPSRRYGSAGDLAADLRRYLNNEPILARRTPAWERAWKWGKRRPAIVALLAAGLLAVVSSVLFVLWHNTSLRWQLDQALSDERLSRQREEEALESERLVRVRAESEKLFDAARRAAARRDWPDARLILDKALITIGADAQLESLKAPAQSLLGQVERELRVEAERTASKARLERFVGLRDRAYFLGTLYTGMDLTTNLKAAREAVHQALDVYGLSTRKTGKPDLEDNYLNQSQKAEIIGDCYQLALTLAEAKSQPATEGNLREAVRLLDVALQFGTPSRAYHLRRARYLTLLKDPAAAMAEKEAAGSSVLHVLDHFLMADEYYRRGQLAEAIEEFDHVLARDPRNFWAHYVGALCLLRQQRFLEAKGRLDACLALRSDFVWSYLMHGLVQGELKATAAAEADFARAAQMSLDEHARYVLQVHRGVLRIRQGRLDDAIGDLKKAVALTPKGQQAYANLADAYRRQGRLDLAADQMDRAIAVEPSLAQLYRNRARLRLACKQPALALKDFDQAIALDTADSPHEVEDRVERGRLLLAEGKHEQALGSFDLALKRNKEHLTAQRLRAEALFHLGRFEQVVAAFDRYLETGKPRESVYRGRGLARAELGKYPGAIEDFTKALEMEPTSAVQAYRGWAHLVCDAPKLALRDFQLALQLDPKNSDAYCGRGFVLAGQGRHREAIRDAEDAVKYGPRSPRLLYNAARIHARCGGDSETRAIELITEALGSLPADVRAAFWAKYVQKDNALEAIRRQARILQLEAELNRKR